MKHKNILKEAGVLLVAAILILTAIIIVPMTMAQQPGHDVGVSNIISPFSGCLRTYPVNVTVKNYGAHTETFDVQVNIFKCDAEEILIEEDFFTWPPTGGWTYSGYVQSSSSYAGGILPAAEAYYGRTSYVNYGWIMTPPVDASNCCKIILEFNLAGYFDPSYDPYFYVTWTNDGGANWHDVTPWSNPVIGNLEPERYSIDIPGGCGGCGNDFQVRWYFDSPYYYLQYGSGIYLDDVKIVKTCVDGEYTEIVEDVTVDFGDEVFVNFPDWTPSDYGEYCVTAFTLFENDNDQSNDCKTVNIIVTDDLEGLIDDLLTYFETFKPDDPSYGWYNPPHNKLKQANNSIILGLDGDPCDGQSKAHFDTAIDRLNKFIGNVEDLVPSHITLDEANTLINAARSIIGFLTYCIPCG